MSFEIITDTPEKTRAIGRRLGSLCTGGERLMLYGPLGAGKTCFVQGLALGLGVPEEDHVTSPTFVIHVQHHGRVDLNHLDAHRLAGAPDLDDLGLDEIFYGDGVSAVEWADVLGDEAPPDRIDIQFMVEGAERRRIHFTAIPHNDPTHAPIVASLEKHARDLVV